MIPLDPAILEFEYEWREGSRTNAIKVAKDFVNLYRSTLTPIFGKYSLDELVKEMDELRKCGAERYHDRLVTDMWILSEFPLSNITGEAHVTVKVPRSHVDGYL